MGQNLGLCTVILTAEENTRKSHLGDSLNVLRSGIASNVVAYQSSEWRRQDRILGYVRHRKRKWEWKNEGYPANNLEWSSTFPSLVPFLASTYPLWIFIHPNFPPKSISPLSYLPSRLCHQDSFRGHIFHRLLLQPIECLSPCIWCIIPYYIFSPYIVIYDFQRSCDSFHVTYILISDTCRKHVTNVLSYFSVNRLVLRKYLLRQKYNIYGQDGSIIISLKDKFMIHMKINLSSTSNVSCD